MALENLVRIFALNSNSRDELFGKLVSYIDSKLDLTIHNLCSDEKKIEKYVLIDLGNIHNVLKVIDGRLPWNIYAFADKCFNGYGVNPQSTPAVKIVRAMASSKNAADIHIIWTAAEICQKENLCEIHVITKDRGFMELEELAKSNNHILKFHQSGESFFQYLKDVELFQIL